MTPSACRSRAARTSPPVARLLVALFLLSSLASTLPLCSAARPRSARVLGLQSSSSAQYVHGSTSTTDRSLPKLSIVTKPTPALRTYTLPKGTVMHHATQYAFDYLKEKQVWFALDAAEGFPLVVGNQLHAIQEAKREEPSRVLPPADIYLRKCTARHDLNLYLMAATEADSRAHLLGLHHPKTKKPLLNPTPLRQKWYAKVTATTQAFVDEFCAKMPQLGYVGWRNPWDQDEIMLCDNINAHVECDGGKLCPASRWSSQVGLDDGDDPRTAASAKPFYLGFKAEDSGPTNRFHFFVLNQKAPLFGQTFEQLDAANQARAVINAACDERPDLNSIVHAQAEWNKNNQWPWYKLKAAQTARWFGIHAIPLPLPAPLPAKQTTPPKPLFQPAKKKL